MSFLKKLFSRKAGGSLFGNIVRRVVAHYTGGIFGDSDAPIRIAGGSDEGSNWSVDTGT